MILTADLKFIMAGSLLVLLTMVGFLFDYGLGKLFS